MRLYHRLSRPAAWFIFIAVLVLSACSPPQATPQAEMQVTLSADEQTYELSIPTGSTVAGALENAGITPGELDRVDPPEFTLLTPGSQITIIRVREEFSVERETIPFESQVLQTESLTDQEKMLAQSGRNGVREITYRFVYEDNELVSREPVKYVVVEEPVPEIVMVGVSQPFIPVTIPGRLAYILGGNAWMMEGSTAQRRPLISSGDLDGRVFRLSKDGNWLLCTRRSDSDEEINRLWVADLQTDPPELFDLDVSNVIHFADWLPGRENTQVIFSTVEARQTAPGWQANNDLHLISFSRSGWVSKWSTLIEANSGGIYGWWGTQFAWDQAGNQLAYTRPDSIGWVDFEAEAFQPLIELTPFQTGGDWAWAPGISWSPDGAQIYALDHRSLNGSNGLNSSAEAAPDFNLIAIPLDGRPPITLAPQVGMFSYPSTSPSHSDNYQVAFLQAAFPAQSESSRYQLFVIDRDGSNQQLLFPIAGQTGLEPQPIVWSPAPLATSNSFALAVIYQGNLWLIDSSGSTAPQQITGDGLLTHLDWKSVVQPISEE